MKQYEKYLKRQGLSKSTIKTYKECVTSYTNKYATFTSKKLQNYKASLIENYKPKTVNLRIQGINKYLDYINKKNLKLKPVKIQQKNFLENVISEADYEFLKNSLKNDGNMFGYFLVRYLAATGARVSEFIQIKVEHVKIGYFDIYSKGGKIRRLYIPRALQIETLQWLGTTGKKYNYGYLFKTKSKKNINVKTVSRLLKMYGQKYSIREEVIYPHSFRHRFAKNFIEKYQDIALLADLMGHDSIETTRIYLRKTASEQRQIVDDIITW